MTIYPHISEQTFSVWFEENSRLIQNDPELVLVLDLNQSEQINHFTNVHKQSLYENKPLSERSTFFGQLREHTLQVVHIVVIEPPDNAPGGMNSFTNREIDRTICDDDIAPFAKCRHMLLMVEKLCE